MEKLRVGVPLGAPHFMPQKTTHKIRKCSRCKIEIFSCFEFCDFCRRKYEKQEEEEEEEEEACECIRTDVDIMDARWCPAHGLR